MRRASLNRQAVCAVADLVCGALAAAVRTPARAACLAGVVAAAVAPASAEPASPDPGVAHPDQHRAELVVGDAAVGLIDALFLQYDPGYLEKIAVRERRLDALAERLFALAAAGRNTRCSEQIFLEAKWLVTYTAWWVRMDDRLDDLKASFAVPDQQGFAAEPLPEDGFYAPCAQELVIRVEATLVNYFDLVARGLLPQAEREPLHGVRTLEGLSAFLERHLISDIPATGEDLRSRSGGLASIIAAADKRDAVMEAVRTTVRGPDLTPEQADAWRALFNRFIDTWQDPESGYWGVWYRDGDRVFKTTDLSITYHIVHARRGDVSHWPELIRTTFALRDQAYPFGWLSDGRWTNHNNYDLARLFDYGWPHMSAAQREEAARTLQEMLTWSFAETVASDFRGFRPNPELAGSLGAEFYFGVSFLVAAGFFEAEPWYGPIERPAPPRDVCRGMIGYGATLDGPLVGGAMSKLERACRPHLGSG
jgi:hypothetical protein